MATATATSTRPPDADRRTRLLVGAGFALTVVAVIVVGSASTQGTVDSQWFRSLEKPPWYPPDAAFGIVWTPLYVLIAISGYLAWRRGVRPVGLVLWGVQLALNLGWSLLFFGLRSPSWAMAEIVVLLAAILATYAEFRRTDRLAAMLLVPYVAWVGFAATLNVAIVLQN